MFITFTWLFLQCSRTLVKNYRLLTIFHNIDYMRCLEESFFLIFLYYHCMAYQPLHQPKGRGVETPSIFCHEQIYHLICGLCIAQNIWRTLQYKAGKQFMIL